ncbi:sigma-70 family RNA polymerase sigma factor [Gimesia aquarii]|uniref:RNA polymerase sigma factor SigX n=1 Tax=Gimesia aquarii TaxID=2527964 RepID=A0A517W0I7_9PLAN|nr:sigma-70 family RNA polymerase sigma factor [Gimesia aquarii]QDT98768.1 RNA polymerase sigma factor SigX [Gimesia aquarii]
MNYGSEWPSTHISLLNRVRVPTDSEAWKEFVNIYGPLIYNYCRKSRLNDSDSEDVCQDVFRQISSSLHTFEYNQKLGRFRSWLGTVTYHEICRFFKKNQRFQNQIGSNGLQEIIYEQPGEIDAVWSDEFCSHIYKAALENIRPEFDDKTWKAFELTWIKDRSPKDTAVELETEIPRVYKAKFLVQRKLKEEIQRLSFDSVVFQK